MCVVSYFNADGSYYLTEQQHQFCNEPQKLKIWTQEPAGTFEWQLTGDALTAIEGGNKLQELERTLVDRNIARVILTSMLAGSGLGIDLSTVQSEAVKIDGKWCEMFDLGSTGNGWASERIYRSKETSQVEMVELKDTENNITVRARCYNYSYSDKLNRDVPKKIDILTGNLAGDAMKLSARIKYISLH